MIRNQSEICLQQWEFCWNYHVVVPFPGQGLPKTDIIGPWFIFLHIYYIRVINGAELIQRWLIHKTFGRVENAQKFGHPEKVWENQGNTFSEEFQGL